MQAKLQPRTVGQLLEVLASFRTNYSYFKDLNNAYQKAIQQVAHKYKVTYQTIGDLCRRRLGLKDIGEFQNLLRTWVNGNSKPLSDSITKCCYVTEHKMIMDFFQSSTPSLITINDTTELKPIIDNNIDYKISFDNALVKKIEILAKFEGKSTASFILEIITATVEAKTNELIKKLT